MEQEAVESDSDGSEDMGRKKRPVGCSPDLMPSFFWLVACNINFV